MTAEAGTRQRWGSPAQREAVEWASCCWREQAGRRVAEFAACGGLSLDPRRAARMFSVDERTIWRWRRALREGTGP